VSDPPRQPEQGSSVARGDSDGAEWTAPMPRQVANPGDPPVPLSLRPDRVRQPVAEQSGTPGRMAIVQGQVYLVGVLLVLQLWLITAALFELLSGRPQSLWGLTLASGGAFVIALVIALWPRRRVQGR
jgi:hypothetical protein